MIDVVLMDFFGRNGTSSTARLFFPRKSYQEKERDPSQREVTAVITTSSPEG